ncbi:MAG TPA: lipopolysaccharide kinase InaA family protein [Rhodocyclaceae bacterium]|nr:lipopolysaccharide kinase InaA family protein [Rhodocyclaceae bacterium]
MTSWTLAPELTDAEAGRMFGSLDAVFALKGERVARDPLSEVLRVRIEGKCYYVKRYTGAGKNVLRRWLGRPRVRAEWENLMDFRAWGIPTATVVAYGLERRLGGFSRGAMITEEVPDTVDLAHLARTDDSRLRDRGWVAEVSRQVAAITRAMHDRNFVHNDLKWRNLLITNGPPRVYLIDCPSGEYWQGPFLRYRIIKDLACLDKVAKYRLSRTQRLRFYHQYTGHRHLTDSDKARIASILAFFKGRE